MNQHRRWVSSQIGPNGAFFVPRVLRRLGRLEAAFSSLWYRPKSFKYRLLQRFYWNAKSHHHVELADFPVESLFWKRIYSELYLKRGVSRDSLDAALISNHWYQKEVKRVLTSKRMRQLWDGPPGIFLSWSYIAKEVIPIFQQHGWKCVIMQLDGAAYEEEIVWRETERNPKLAPDWRRAPSTYFDEWRQECALADHMIALSAWGAECLRQSGVAYEKISVIPLASENEPRAGTHRQYPVQFDTKRPLRVLFMGQMILRKGIAHLFEAIRRLQNMPIEFVFAGAVGVAVPSDIKAMPTVRLLGRVSREVVDQLYKESDIFILPTLSDAYAITQLEAMARGLPVMASRNCGEVVEDGVNGVLLKNVSAGEIASELMALCETPERLALMAKHCKVPNQCSFDSFGRSLVNLERRLYP